MQLKTLKSFVSFRVPDSVSVYEQRRPHSDAFGAQERRRLAWRCLGVLLGCAALGLLTAALAPGAHWHWRDSAAAWASLWDVCPPGSALQRLPRTNLSETSGGGWGGGCGGGFGQLQLQDWQKASIGLLMFAILFTALGTGLASLGLCISYLPKKMYYFHSAGEIFFVAALSATVALGVYPYAVQKLLLQSHRYGYGYALGWTAAGLLMASALCMMLDDLVRETSRPCALLCCARSAARRPAQLESCQTV